MENDGWKRYPANSILHQGALCFYQKKLFLTPTEDEIYAEIVEWPPIAIRDHKIWELEIQIPDKLCIVGQTLNILAFSYLELDFDKIEGTAKTLITSLLKPNLRKFLR